MALTVSDLDELLRLLEANPELLRALQDRIVDEQAILRVLSQRAEAREAIRRYVLQDELLELPALVRELIEAQRRHEAILQEHSNILREHSDILQEHSNILREHSDILQVQGCASGAAAGRDAATGGRSSNPCGDGRGMA
ncbi:MAG: hypothetical protein NZL85_02585, partial [Fimbriimonadales bacterium]|nr:hypothetical protein [Fimbriimonadales bacterium]